MCDYITIAIVEANHLHYSYCVSGIIGESNIWQFIQITLLAGL